MRICKVLASRQLLVACRHQLQGYQILTAALRIPLATQLLLCRHSEACRSRGLSRRARSMSCWRS